MKPETVKIRSPKRHFKPLLVAAVLLCLLAGTVFVAAISGNLLSYFETQWQKLTGNTMDESQSQLIHNLTTEIGDRVTSGDNSITLESVTPGENSVWILLRLEAPNTTFSEGNFYNFHGFDCTIVPSPVSEDVGFMGLTIQSEIVNTDGSLSMLLLLDASLPEDTALNSGDYTLNLLFEDVLDSTTANLQVVEGFWEFSIPLQPAKYETSLAVQDLTVPAQIEDTGEIVEVPLTDVFISSTGIRFSYTGEGHMLSITAILKDGTTISTATGGSSRLGTSSTYAVNYQWSVPLNSDEIAAIQFGNFRVPIA